MGGTAPGERGRGLYGTDRRPRIAADLDFGCGGHTARVRPAFDCAKCMTRTIYTLGL